jgi:hypothetical protein
MRGKGTCNHLCGVRRNNQEQLTPTLMQINTFLKNPLSSRVVRPQEKFRRVAGKC